MSAHLLDVFPGLRTTLFRITSPADSKYNCIAWAANDVNRWWWPEGDGPSVAWPDEAARALTLDSFTAAFRALGFHGGSDESLEADTEKIALFTDAMGTPTHAARQLPTGLWTSKLGHGEDIEHELRALEGEVYGKVAVVLKRKAPRS